MDDENKMRILIDTGTTMSAGNNDYYQWVTSQCLCIVAKYLKCGSGTKYDIVQILVYLNLKETHKLVVHGSMTAVVRYKIPYIINNTYSLILSFVLGTEITLRNALGIPCLSCFFGVENKEFPLQIDPPGKGYEIVLSLNISLLLYLKASLQMF